MKLVETDDYSCKIGQSAKENWQILDEASKDDIFFHLTSFPSCYVILSMNDDPTIYTLKECAKLCLENTKYKDMKGVYVDYTYCENVKKGRKTGEIYYRFEKKVKKLKVSL